MIIKNKIFIGLFAIFAPLFFVSSANAVVASKAYVDAIVGAIAVPVQSDWNQSDNTAADYIRNKPDISGGGGGVQSDWNQTNSAEMDFIRNKPDVVLISGNQTITGNNTLSGTTTVTGVLIVPTPPLP